MEWGNSLKVIVKFKGYTWSIPLRHVQRGTAQHGAAHL